MQCNCGGSGVVFVEIFTGGFLGMPCHCVDDGERQREYISKLEGTLKELLDRALEQQEA